ncbi:MAG: AraC family transcriptional regulator [Kiritimatiellae bacterium]|nr:AraC family transcriptional regulator [Kiritimatiellia bacterium]
MKPYAEKIQFLPGESFRLLQWVDNIREVEIVSGDKTRIPLTGSGHEWHSHSHMELTVVDRGSGTRFIGDSITHFTAPDLVIIGPHLPHYWHMHGQSSGCAVQFELESDHSFWKLPETRMAHQLWQDANLGIQITGDGLQKIKNLMQSCCTCSGIRRLRLFIQIIELLAGVSSKDRIALSRTSFMPPNNQSTYVSLQKTIRYVLQNFQNEISFYDILQESHMSKATFQRHFKKLTNKTFTRFLTDLRLSFAGRKLIESDLSVSEIAFASGYNNLSHFNHQFKVHYQLAPLAFRKAAGRKNRSG